MKEIKCGLLGKDLKHSYSQEIHENLFLEYKETFKNDFLDSSNDIGLNYKLISIEENELESFLKKRDFDYLNVTIPYKQKIMKYLDSISIEAQEINAVNLIINKNGILTGYNTDSYGFEKSLERNKIELSNYHNCLILGTGGAQKAVYYSLKEKNQIEMNISLASRQENKQYLTYEEVKEKCEKFDFVVNCTPVGMYPLINSEIIDINTFKNVKLVYDLVYNPLNTLLIQKAKKRNIKTINGLEMLVYQAMKTLNIFFNLEDNNQNNQDFEKIFTKVYDYLLSKQNIVLIGMPGSGKSTISKILSKNINEFIINKFILNNYEKCFIDTDEEIIKEFGNIDDLFHNPSIKEEGFRKIEKDIVKKYAILDNQIISTGGGVILDEENMIYLKSKGIIIFINRDLESIYSNMDNNRPLIKSKEDLEKLYSERVNKYIECSDYQIDNDNINETIEKILNIITKKN